MKRNSVIAALFLTSSVFILSFLFAYACNSAQPRPEIIAVAVTKVPAATPMLTLGTVTNEDLN